MTFHVYLMPAIGAGTLHDPYKPKYWESLGSSYGQLFYVPEPFCLAGADLTLLEHTALLLNLDVLAYPANLDSSLNILTDLLFTPPHDNAEIPTAWMDGLTYREIARRVRAVFQISMRMRALNQHMLSIDLTQALTAYTSTERAAFYQACSDLGFDTSGVVNTTALGVVLGDLSAQWSGTSFVFGGVTI